LRALYGVFESVGWPSFSPPQKPQKPEQINNQPEEDPFGSSTHTYVYLSSRCNLFAPHILWQNGRLWTRPQASWP